MIYLRIRFFLRDDGTVAVDVLTDQVIEQTTTLTYKDFQRTSRRIVLVVCLEALCEMLDAYREKSNCSPGCLYRSYSVRKWQKISAFFSGVRYNDNERIKLIVKKPFFKKPAEALFCPARFLSKDDAKLRIFGIIHKFYMHFSRFSIFYATSNDSTPSSGHIEYAKDTPTRPSRQTPNNAHHITVKHRFIAKCHYLNISILTGYLSSFPPFCKTDLTNCN